MQPTVARPIPFDSANNAMVVDKSRDEASGAEKTVLLNPDSTTYVTETLVDTTNVATATYYPSSSGLVLDGYRNISFCGTLIDGAAETTTLTVEVSNYGGTTAADWMQVYHYDAINNTWVTSISATNATTYFANCIDNVGDFAYIRFKITTSAATNTVKITIKRNY